MVGHGYVSSFNDVAMRGPLLERLELGHLVLVVGRLDSYQPRQTLNSQMLFREPMQVIARPNHPLTLKSNLSWNDLYGFDWIHWPEGTPIRQRLDSALSNGGLKPLPSRVESSSLMANLWLLQTSDMLSVASGRVAEHFTHRGLVKALDFEMDAEGSIGVCWRDEPYIDMPFWIFANAYSRPHDKQPHSLLLK